MGLLEKLFGFTDKQKLDHYTKVASGKKDIKENSKFSREEQMAYARGQRDARNEAKRQWKYKNSTVSEREDYAIMQQIKRDNYKQLKKEQAKKNGK